MALFNPLTQAQWIAIGLDAYSAAAATPAYTGPGSAMGAIAYDGARTAMQAQQQLLYLAAIARLATIPALPNGQPSPDAISFAAPFGIAPLGSAAASGLFLCTTASPVSQGPLVIPVGGVAITPGGTQFVVVADLTNSNYSVALGGYPINNGDVSTTVTMTALASGSLGNLVADTPLSPYNSAGAVPIVGIATISNPSALTNGDDGESDAAFKARFTLTVSSGRAGTANAVIASVLDIQPGLIYSFGDRVNADGSTHNAFFTFVVNEAGTGTAPSGALLSEATAAINSVTGRSAGISFTCIGPTLQNINVHATLTSAPGFNDTDVIAAATTQLTTYLNNIGMNPDTTPMSVSIAKIYAVLLATQINGVNCVADVPSLTVNGQNTGDITVPFAYQAVCGNLTFTATT